jgi:tripeptidyl-peptidase I
VHLLGRHSLVSEIQADLSYTEALLDFQISYPVIYPQNSVLFLTDDIQAAENFTGGLFNTFLDAIDGSYCTYSAFGETGDSPQFDPVYPNKGWKHPAQCGVYSPTNVISFSYELAEFNEGTTESYQKRQCLEYMKLGLQGVSVVFSSGDAGVETNWGCAANSKGVSTSMRTIFSVPLKYADPVDSNQRSSMRASRVTVRT